MTISIDKNIRAFRKERKLTQEQLAEALGVTVGAVSKWESGSSIPDIMLIVELADFFETSVDVLLGYKWLSESLKRTVDQIRLLRNEKRFDEAAVAAEKALKKHPNSFDIVYQCAVMYQLRGVELNCEKSYKRSLALLERALELIDQNTDEHINRWTIRNNIASVYLHLNQNEKALELLKQNNAEGLNDCLIGYVLAVAEKKSDEALPHLSSWFISALVKLMRMVVSYANAYEQKQDYDSAIDIISWMQNALKGLEQDGKVSYLDRMEVRLLSANIHLALKKGDVERAKSFLTEAIAVAERFDLSPEYGFSKMKFFHGKDVKTAFDDFGKSAKNGLRHSLELSFDTAEQALKLWKQLENGGKDNE